MVVSLVGGTVELEVGGRVEEELVMGPQLVSWPKGLAAATAAKAASRRVREMCMTRCEMSTTPRQKAERVVCGENRDQSKE